MNTSEQGVSGARVFAEDPVRFSSHHHLKELYASNNLPRIFFFTTYAIENLTLWLFFFRSKIDIWYARNSRLTQRETNHWDSSLRKRVSPVLPCWTLARTTSYRPFNTASAICCMFSIKSQNFGASSKHFCKQMFNFDTLDSNKWKCGSFKNHAFVFTTIDGWVVI